MKRKSFVVALTAAMMAAALVVGGTLAYFTDKTETKNNTFTIGNVDIELTEDVTADPDKGYEAGTVTEDGADYHIMPGLKYAKDVNITVENGSEESYVFVELSFSPANDLWNILDDDQNMLGQLLVGYDTEIFKGDKLEDNLMGRNYDEATDTYTEVYFCGVKEAGDVIDLFEAVQIPAGLTDQEFPTINFNIEASAIQAAGIEDAQKAYKELGFTWTTDGI